MLSRILYYKHIFIDDLSGKVATKVVEFGPDEKGLGLFARVDIPRGSTLEIFGYNTKLSALVPEMFPSITIDNDGSKSKTSGKKNKKIAKALRVDSLKGRMDGSLALCNHACIGYSHCTFKNEDKCISEWYPLFANFKKEMNLQDTTKLFRLHVEKDIKKDTKILVNYKDPPPNCMCPNCRETLTKTRSGKIK